MIPDVGRDTQTSGSRPPLGSSQPVSSRTIGFFVFAAVLTLLGALESASIPGSDQITGLVLYLWGGGVVLFLLGVWSLLVDLRRAKRKSRWI